MKICIFFKQLISSSVSSTKRLAAILKKTRLDYRLLLKTISLDNAILEFWFSHHGIEKISLTSPVVINVLTRASLAVEIKGLLFLWLAHLDNKRNVCKQICSQYNCTHHFSVLQNKVGKIYP